jgi:DNA end-binding protein Ku
MRAIWKGSISFSLVNIPIALYPATRREEIKFHLLRKKDLSPIKYRRVAETDHQEVPWEEIVKGYEYEKGQFVVIEEEDFKRADIEATQTVDILEFVPLQDIDPMFFDKPYYLEPEKKGVKAYALLREALKRSGKVGIAKVVLKTRQHLAAVKPDREALVLELMHFSEELVDSKELQIPTNLELGAKELEMAGELITRMTTEWQADKYTDDYRHALMNLIEQKAQSGGQSPSMPALKREPTKVIDLVAVLQESLNSTKGSPEKSGDKRSSSSAKKTKPRKVLKKAA